MLALVSLAIINCAYANESDSRPFKKGSFQQIQQEHKGQSFIVTFWSETCAYCMKELALFGKLSKKYPTVDIVSVTTDPFLDDQTVKRILSSKNLDHVQKWVFADNYAERLYFDVDRTWRGELPLTLFFDRQNKMLKHMGVIKKDELIDWLEAQNRAQK